MEAGGEVSGCVFCKDNWPNLRSVTREMGPDLAIIHPLNPVTEGHVLVISSFHSTDAADNPKVAAELMLVAALYVAKKGIQANIITSVGPDATQTVMHAHVHVVPRTAGDGLPLPWTPQQEDARRLAELRSGGRD